MKYAQVWAGAGQHGIAQCIEVFYFLVLHDVGEAFALHAGHVDYVAGIYYVFGEFRVFAVGDVFGVAESAVFGRHTQFVGSDETECGIEIAHCHQQRVDGASVFQVADHGYCQIVEPSLCLEY